MAWDFATEPEFEAQLDWMRGFVRDEIIPLETLDLDRDDVRPHHRPAEGAGAASAGCGPRTCHPSWAAAGSARSSWA